MNPCQWWPTSPQGESVFDCNVLSDAVCNNGQRGNRAREVIAGTGREEHKSNSPKMKGLPVRAAIDQSFGQWNVPADPDDWSFVYVPVPEDSHPRRKGLETT